MSEEGWQAQLAGTDLAGNEILAGIPDIPSLARRVVEGETMSWRDRYLKDSPLYDDPSLATIENPQALAKSYVETKGLVGRKGVLLPKEGDAADLERFQRELGRPETVEGYEIQRPAQLPDDFPYEEELERGFKEWALEAGLTPAAAQTIYNRFMEANMSRFEQYKQNVAALNEELKTKWGDQYQEKMATAQKAWQTLLPEGAKAILSLDYLSAQNPKLDPILMEWFYELGTKMSEGRLVMGQNAGVSAGAQRLEELRRSPAYTKADHPDHAKVVKEVTELYQQLNQEE